uniref:2-nitropropane dioxygenase n=1 Tax=Tolypothrix bouteillei VB521301 TaxID=1479485 RepID=A0A0C1R7C3_9CYAN
MADTVRVECPCCGATLEVHVATGSVISHEEVAKKPAIEDLAAAAAKLKDQAAKRDDLFQQSMASHKAKSAAADDLFDQLLKKAKEKPDAKPPKRAFDLD